MRDPHIHAKLGIHDRPKCRYQNITRGATTILKISFNSKAYTFSDIKQITYLFQQGTAVEVFKAIDYFGTDASNWALDSHFTYDEVLDCLSFVLNADETVALFEASDLHDLLVNFEIVVELNNDVSELAGATVVEKQPPLYVLDSLYGRVLGNEIGTDSGTSEAAIVSNSLYCSDDLYCKN